LILEFPETVEERACSRLWARLVYCDNDALLLLLYRFQEFSTIVLWIVATKRNSPGRRRRSMSVAPVVVAVSWPASSQLWVPQPVHSPEHEPQAHVTPPGQD
jgi:hypothetical protein